MEPSSEIRRLLDLMSASGRMMTKIISKPEQATAIESPFPFPWSGERKIFINFDLWSRIPKPQRDMLLLRTVTWLISIKWFKPDIYQGIVLVGMLGGMVELLERDVVGMTIAGGLTAIATTQIWRKSRSTQLQLEADEAAIKIAVRRGYTETEAAKHLMRAIETVAEIEKRSSLDFIELLRCQNLRAIAGLSSLGVPDTLKQE